MSLDLAQAINDLAEDNRLAATPERRAFASLLVDVADAVSTIIQVDDGLLSVGDENSVIENCLNKEIILEQVIADAKLAADQLQLAINSLQESRKE